MDEEHTTAVVQRYLDELGGDTPAESAVRALLDRAVRRLHELCAALLHRSYPRLTRPPLNLQADELLGAVVERLLKALREVRPGTVRQFFTLASQHMRWELNEMARRLDEQPAAVELRDHTTVQTMRVREVKDEAERARLWKLAVAAYPPYEEYQAKTTRRIPLFVAEAKR